MFHFIGLNMVLIILHYGHLLSSMLPGCTIRYLVEQQDSLSPNTMLIIAILCPTLVCTPSFKRIRKLQNGISMIRWVSFMVSWKFTHLWWQLSGNEGLVCSSSFNVVCDFFQTVCSSGENNTVFDAICNLLFKSHWDVYAKDEFSVNGKLIYFMPPLDEVWPSEPEH